MVIALSKQSGFLMPQVTKKDDWVYRPIGRITGITILMRNALGLKRTGNTTIEFKAKKRAYSI